MASTQLVTALVVMENNIYSVAGIEPGDREHVLSWAPHSQ